jgi:hypothetical protein
MTAFLIDVVALAALAAGPDSLPEKNVAPG